MDFYPPSGGIVESNLSENVQGPGSIRKKWGHGLGGGQSSSGARLLIEGLLGHDDCIGVEGIDESFSLAGELCYLGL